MKRILGLDLGTTSIGWAIVDQAENENEKSRIIKAGVRVNPLTADERTNFEKGKSITTTADRNLKHGMRINLQRYKLRRAQLIKILREHHIITDSTPLTEDGNRTTFETYRMRARAATQEITLEQLARVLLMINKKRGYKSNRKTDKNEDGQLIDGMSIARVLYEQRLTPGQYVLEQVLEKGRRNIPSFYRSDLTAEFNLVWDCQARYYPEVFTAEMKEKAQGRNSRDTNRLFFAVAGVNGEEIKDRKTRLLAYYQWRAQAVSAQIPLERAITVLCNINGDLANSSGYLGRISDYSKELAFNNQTVGQYLMRHMDADPHFSVKNKVFYRQDYLHEFNVIWETQAKFHRELTDELKHKVRDTVIFYQRRLKSKKKLLDVCELEGKEMEVKQDGVTKHITTGPRVAPKSSPIFQEFKLWQQLNHLTVGGLPLTQEQKTLLYHELLVNKELSKSKVQGLLKAKKAEVNFDKLQGNLTQVAMMQAYKNILEWSGHDVENFDKMSYEEKMLMVRSVFSALDAKTDFLEFNVFDLGDYTRQPAYRLWHLIYSYEDDKSPTGNESLIAHISRLTGLTNEYAKALAAVTFASDYGDLSAKAMARLLPHMLNGLNYSDACQAAGYRHSKRSLTKEEIENRPLDSRLQTLSKNTLRNPVVEKIVNQMINVVNAAMEEYGGPQHRFDEIHIEMARELKQTQQQREDTYRALQSRTNETGEIVKRLKEEFNIPRPSRNDIIRYRLYEELKMNGYHTLYSNTYIARENIFSRDFDIEHIIPQAKMFDDSIANKTLEARTVNLQKSDRTARDYVVDTYGPEGEAQYMQRIAYLNKPGTRRKYQRLTWRACDIPGDFLHRDLSDSQYIARKASEILTRVCRVIVTTNGSITDRLRQDWQLVDVLKELNLPKYRKLGLVETYENSEHKKIEQIKDWTKRNDHRHHAMDAITIAFTRREHIQLLNYLSSHDGAEQAIAHALKRKLVANRCFIPPMPIDELRHEAKRQLGQLLVSFKAKNKVVTRNVNKIARSSVRQRTLTPRHQLHNETVYGLRHRYVTEVAKVDAKMDAQRIATVANARQRHALMNRLDQFGGNAKLAFTGKNALKKVPVYLDDMHTRQVPERVKLVRLETYFTVRKPVGKDLRIEKVVDRQVRRVLEERKAAFGGDTAKAFANLEENPIWLNQEKGIAVKRVTIDASVLPIALHIKRDKWGNALHDSDGNTVPSDYVETAGNHHIAIYEDPDGNWQEEIVSYFEATRRAVNNEPIVNKCRNRDKGWKFMFTMKQNEYFVFPAQGFNPADIDLTDTARYADIAPHLFRVQKLSSHDYMFRHQYETSVTAGDSLPQGEAFIRITTINKMKGAVKVRVNHIGKIVAVGEY